MNAHAHPPHDGLPAQVLIGLMGRPGSGKDTCAQALCTQHGFHAIAFADALRKEVSAAFRIDPRTLLEPATKEWPIKALAIGMSMDPFYIRAMLLRGHDLDEPRSPRWTLQHWGTDYRRTQQASYWLTPVATWVRHQRAIGRNRLLVTDVRFPDEASLIGLLGGRRLRVHRPELAPMPDDTAGHESEQHAESLEAHGTVANAGTLEQLRAAAVQAIAGLSLAEVPG